MVPGRSEEGQCGPRMQGGRSANRRGIIKLAPTMAWLLLELTCCTSEEPHAKQHLTATRPDYKRGKCFSIDSCPALIKGVPVVLVFLSCTYMRRPEGSWQHVTRWHRRSSGQEREVCLQQPSARKRVWNLSGQIAGAGVRPRGPALAQGIHATRTLWVLDLRKHASEMLTASANGWCILARVSAVPIHNRQPVSHPQISSGLNCHSAFSYWWSIFLWPAGL